LTTIRRRIVASATLVLTATLTSAMLGACLFDPDDRCGENQVVLGENLRCVCAEGYARTEAGCVACGEHEMVTPTGCACEDGYVRPTANAACVPQGSLGSECDDDAPCNDPVYSYCEPEGGYCTNTDCESSEDCQGGYACDTSADPAICRRPPTGLGVSCTSDADCADYDATFCDLVVARQCLVQGCTVEPNDCFEGYTCCDFKPFVPQPICIPGNSCMQAPP
jgi:hypothetical protein